VAQLGAGAGRKRMAFLLNIAWLLFYVNNLNYVNPLCAKELFQQKIVKIILCAKIITQ
jgi:hypothetical protein